MKIFGALLAATLGVVVLPRLAKALFPNAALGWERVLALNALIFLFWRDHFDFPLADFPALTAASIGVILLLRGGTWGYALAGLSLGLAASMRGNYWFAFLAAVLVTAIVPLRGWSWRTRGAAVGLVLAGAFAVSLPQMLMNHRHHDTWSPGVANASEQNLVTTWLGVRAQKYETYIGPASSYPQPGVFYLDPATRRLLEEENITPVIRLGRPSFPSSSRYLRLVLEHPLQMAASYFRHVFNGLDVKYPTPYVRDLDNKSMVLSLLNYTAPVRRARAAPRARSPTCSRTDPLVGHRRAARRARGRDRDAGRAAVLPAAHRARLHARLLRPGDSRVVTRRQHCPAHRDRRRVCGFPVRLPDAFVQHSGSDRVSAGRRTQRSTLSSAVSTPTRSAPPPPAIDEPSPDGGGIALSIVVPVYNEEENVDELYGELTMAGDGLGRPYEIVVVDDGSTDETYARLKRLAASDPRLKVIHFGRNFGQTAAMAAGFDHAEGDVVVPLDGDLQNDPADIALLLEKLDEGYDVVSGWRKDRKDNALAAAPVTASPTG